MDHIPRDPMVPHRCQAPGTPGTGTGAPSEAGKELWGRSHYENCWIIIIYDDDYYNSYHYHYYIIHIIQ